MAFVPVINGWQMSASEFAACKNYVTLDTDNIGNVLPWLSPSTQTDAWRSYVSPLDNQSPNLARLFFELALTISQFGGFVGKLQDGTPDIWKRHGSGVKELIATMDAIRRAHLLPGIDTQNTYREKLACYFMSAPFAKQRIDMMLEIAEEGGIAFFEQHLAKARLPNGSYHFTAMHMEELATRLPLSFGEDAPFYKKASLLLLTMEIALKNLGHDAKADTPPPADYRIPQILEGLGVLHYSADVTGKIEADHIFELHDPEVRAIRAMTVIAVGHIAHQYAHTHGQALSCAELDSMLYTLSRNTDLMGRASMKPHIKVATCAF